jgi:hypothetical protein
MQSDSANPSPGFDSARCQIPVMKIFTAEDPLHIVYGSNEKRNIPLPESIAFAT